MIYASPILELSDADKRNLSTCSVERMINTSIRIAQVAEESKNEKLSELGSTSWQDWDELKPLVLKLWNYHAELHRVEAFNALQGVDLDER